jgi:hypothetical protein
VATRASGHAERLAAMTLIEPFADRPRPVTLGAGAAATDAAARASVSADLLFMLAITFLLVAFATPPTVGCARCRATRRSTRHRQAR